jgi:hypothetical protein
LKVMEEFNIQGKQTPFYKYCPGTCGYTLVVVNLDWGIPGHIAGVQS